MKSEAPGIKGALIANNHVQHQQPKLLARDSICASRCVLVATLTVILHIRQNEQEICRRAIAVAKCQSNRDFSVPRAVRNCLLWRNLATVKPRCVRDSLSRFKVQRSSGPFKSFKPFNRKRILIPVPNVPVVQSLRFVQIVRIRTSIEDSRFKVSKRTFIQETRCLRKKLFR